MIVKIISEYGFDEAMLGLSLSYNQPVEKMVRVSKSLYNKGAGHSKFLESMVVTLDMTASRSFWQQFDTYRIGVTKQSESTMHTLTKKPLVQSDFEDGIPKQFLEYLNLLISRKNLIEAKRILPEAFLQRRIVVTNYKTLRNILLQRIGHKLPEWQYFISEVISTLQHQEYVIDIFFKFAEGKNGS